MKNFWILLILIGVAIFVVMATFLTPRAVSSYYQMRGGQRLDRVVRELFEQPQFELMCGPLDQEDTHGISELALAVGDLNQAISLNPSNSHAYLQLGKAHCLLGAPDKARISFQKYAELRPNNPLGYMGLGFTNERVNDPKAAKLAWRKAGIAAEDFQSAGDKAFGENEFDIAKDWYIRSIIIDINYTPAWLGLRKLDDLIGWSIDTIPNTLSSKVKIIESFINLKSWRPYPTNSEGTIVAKNGIMEMRYRNNFERRDTFTIYRNFNQRISQISELNIRTRSASGALLTVETVIDGKRVRMLNYAHIGREWELISIPISGNYLESISIGTSEASAKAETKEYSLNLDWIALR